MDQRTRDLVTEPAPSREEWDQAQAVTTGAWHSRLKKMDVPLELMALLCYLHQQEAWIRETLRQMQAGG